MELVGVPHVGTGWPDDVARAETCIFWARDKKGDAMTAPNVIEGVNRVESDLSRAVMATACSQVVVATTAAHGRAHGTTVTAFASILLDPPLVAVSLDNKSLLLAQIRHSRRLGINVLAHDQQDLALVWSGKGAGKFDSVPWTETKRLPRIAGSVG